jgi:hypothetical protein
VRWGLAIGAMGLVGVLCGAGAAQGPAAPPDEPARMQALNEEALHVLDQIRQAYPIDFAEEPAVHRAVRAQLLAGRDPAEVRRMVKVAVVQGCRQACMRAATDAFTRLNAEGLEPARVQEILVENMKAARNGMPRQYTYEMLGARFTELVDANTGTPGKTP